jgi:glycosyltransferase involved in cell wall biosynthesis
MLVPQISIVMACFNEEKYVSRVIEQVLSQECVAEFIIIDDASTDKSYEIMKSFQDPRIIILRNKSNLGKGACIKRGLESATKNIVGIQDADLEYDPKEYLRMIQPLIEGKADAVFGSRFLTFGSRRVLFYWHRLGNQFLTFLVNVVTNLDLTDMETCFKFISLDFAKRLEVKENRFGIEPEVTIKLARMKARIYEVPISYSGRTYEEGKKIGWKDGFSAIFCIIKYGLLLRRS